MKNYSTDVKTLLKALRHTETHLRRTASHYEYQAERKQENYEDLLRMDELGCFVPADALKEASQRMTDALDAMYAHNEKWRDVKNAIFHIEQALYHLQDAEK